MKSGKLQSLLFVIVCCAVLTTAVYWLAQRQPQTENAKAENDVRDRLADNIEQASREITRDNLDEYLNSLLKRAERSGRATAMEVEPGVQLILALTGDPVKLQEFTSRMQAINEAADKELSPREAEFELARLSDAFISARPGSVEHSQLVENYIQAAAYLPPEAGGQAMQQLNQLAGLGEVDETALLSADPLTMKQAAPPVPKQTTDYNAIRHELAQSAQLIGNTSDEAERAGLLQHYLETANALPPEEMAQAIEQLSAYLPPAAQAEAGPVLPD